MYPVQGLDPSLQTHLGLCRGDPVGGSKLGAKISKVRNKSDRLAQWYPHMPAQPVSVADTSGKDKGLSWRNFAPEIVQMNHGEVESLMEKIQCSATFGQK